jgi:bacterioferritin (cytochrome b1)
MTKSEMIEKLKSDLANEYTHLLFYLQHSSTIVGLHRLEYQELMTEQATSEMKHVKQFSDIIVGLGGIPSFDSHSFPTLVDPEQIIEYAIQLESTVTENYLQRMKDAEELGGVDGMGVHLFLEEQFQDSYEDLINFQQVSTKI